VVTIRTANKNDAELVLSLSRKTFVQTFAAQNSEADMQAYLAEYFTLARIREEFLEPNATFLLAFVNEIPAGYAKLNQVCHSELPAFSKQTEVARIYVLQKFQGQKVGKVLFEICLAFSLQAGSEIVWLGVWEHNQKAIEFYQKFGFKKFSQHIFQLGSDAQTDHLMYLELN
jgi:GNAT superfamily N-acetyltransferase